MQTRKKIYIPQIDGVIREVTLTAADAEIVRRDRTQIDVVDPLTIVDVYPDGTRMRIR